MGEADKYIETFRQEAEELLADVEEIVLAIEDDPDDCDNINRLFRAMHTIKGSGAMFGFEDIAAFTHHVETALDMVRSGKLSITKELIDLILVSRDQIMMMLNASQGGPAADEAVCAGIVSGLNRLTTANMEGSKAAIACPPLDDTAQETHQDNTVVAYTICFQPDPGLFAMGMDPALLMDELSELGDCEVCANLEHLPSLEELDPESCYLAWDILLMTDQGIDAIKDVFIFVEDVSKVQIEVLQADTLQTSNLRLSEILEERGDITPHDVEDALSKQICIGELLVDSGATTKESVNSALAAQHTQNKSKTPDKSETLRVSSGKLDTLVNLVGELVINQARLTQISACADNPDLSMTVEEVERLTGELRDTVLNIRMMPIGTTFGRFKRLVRDLSDELGKEIEMVTKGEETELDKTVIDRLADPLVHLIRNSIDHGIEQPEQRKLAGKQSKGIIRLSAAHTGTNVVITVEDDGHGLDTEMIIAKAIERGIISADDELSDSEIFALIFAPGFSTASTVTSVSGRGVGMDVVKREIDNLRGNISISSEKGQGTKIDLSLPLTLAIIDGLLVHVNNDPFVIPLSLIEECLELTKARLAMGTDRNVIQLRGEPIPFIRLREVFDIHGERPPIEEVVVVSAGGVSVGIVVDRVIGDHQTVIKSLGKAYKDVEGVSGATILGDGNVALILDVPGLVRCAKTSEDKILLGA